MKRRAKSWEGIISQLRCNDWGIEEISERFLYKSEVQVTPKDVWQRIHGCKGLWAMYKNSPVLVQLADYAAEHGDGVDQELLEGLRSDAFQIRLCVLLALAQYLLSSSTVGASVNAHRAVATYSAMMVGSRPSSRNTRPPSSPATWTRSLSLSTASCCRLAATALLRG